MPSASDAEKPKLQTWQRQQREGSRQLRILFRSMIISIWKYNYITFQITRLQQSLSIWIPPASQRRCIALLSCGHSHCIDGHCLYKSDCDYHCGSNQSSCSQLLFAELNHRFVHSCDCHGRLTTNKTPRIGANIVLIGINAAMCHRLMLWIGLVNIEYRNATTMQHAT